MKRRPALLLALALLGCDDTSSDPTLDALAPDAAVEDAALDVALEDAEPDATVEDAAPDVAIEDATPDAAVGDAVIDAVVDAIIDAGPDPLSDEDEDGLTWAQEAEAGTDPANPDTDGDAVLDGDEVEAGTDPLEISSAPAWHPERLAGRPRLFFGPEDLEGVLARTEGPIGQAIFDAVRARAERALVEEEEAYDRHLSVRRAETLEARAFVAFLESDQEAAEAVAEALAVPSPDPGDIDPFSAYDLSEAEAMIARCTAYDLIGGMISEGAAAAAEANVRHLLDTYARLCLAGSVRPMVALSRNNHAMKTQGALGLCALTFNDGPEQVAYLHEGLTGLHHLLTEIQGHSSGAYAEGWNYLTYGGVSYLPFLLAYHRFAQGEAMTYRALGESVFPFAAIGELVTIPDLAEDPTVRLIFERGVQALRPDGLTPPVDDGNPVVLPGGLMAALFDDPELRWRWQPTANVSRLGVATLAVLEEEVIEAPSWPLDLSYPEAGWTSLRTGFGPLDHQLFILGEHGPPRENGFGHEHPDGASFYLFAHGHPLLIDPGYVNWDNHALVNQPEHHNIILVDGEGPPSPTIIDVGADAYLEPLEAGAWWTSQVVRTAYLGVEFERRFVRVGAGEAYVVHDRVVGDAPHRYTALLHGQGFIDEGTFRLTDHGGVWAPGPEVEVIALSAPGAPELELRVNEHEQGWGRWAPHTTLALHAPEAAEAAFLTLILTREAPGEITPVVEAREIRVGDLRVRLGEGDLLEIERGAELHRFE